MLCFVCLSCWDLPNHGASVSHSWYSWKSLISLPWGLEWASTHQCINWEKPNWMLGGFSKIIPFFFLSSHLLNDLLIGLFPTYWPLLPTKPKLIYHSQPYHHLSFCLCLLQHAFANLGELHFYFLLFFQDTWQW